MVTEVWGEAFGWDGVRCRDVCRSHVHVTTTDSPRVMMMIEMMMEKIDGFGV